MPKKCITHFDGEPCTGNYDSSNEKVSVFRFPKDPQERALWVNALPSKVIVKDESVLCEKHWPKDFRRKQCQGPLGYRPHDSPTVFGTTPSSCFVQTSSSRLRAIDNRTVSGESRGKKQKIDSEKDDTIMSWDDLKKYSQKVNLVSDLSEDNVIKLYHIQGIPPTITFSIFINGDMKVSAFKGNTSVSLHDVISGFDWKLNKFSELDKVIEKVKYVITGKIQSDRLEGEFGVYHQSSGGNFHISTYQVYNGLKLQRIKLFNQLELSDKLQSSGISECCKGVAHSEDDQEIIDSCFQISTQHTVIEKSALYYISGYVAFKEGCSVSAPDIPNDNSEFLVRVSRGGLGHPPAELFDLSQYLYAFFKTREKKCCPQVFLDAYQLIYESSGFEFPNVHTKLRRFNNCFIKAFAKDINDKLKHADTKGIKQGRISGRRTVPI